MVKLYYSLVYSHLTCMLYWHGEDREVLMRLRLSVLTESMQINYAQIIIKRYSLFTQFMIALHSKQIPLIFINISKLSSHQPSHMHNTRHRTNSNFNTPMFTHSKTQKRYLYQVIPILTSLQISLKIALPSVHEKKLKATS